MKIAISSTGTDLNSQIDPRFGRCAYFIIVETDDMSCEAFNNENINLSGGAGIQSGSFVASKGVKAVLTGRCGPKAMQTLVSAGIEVFTNNTGSVQDVIERYKKDNLTSTTQANASQKSGVSDTGMMDGGKGMGGSGRGMGMGGGGGRGMGMGGGGGMRGSGSEIKKETPSKLKLLKEQAGELKKQLDDIQSEIKNLE